MLPPALALPPVRPRVLAFALELAMGSPLALSLPHAPALPPIFALPPVLPHAHALAPALPPARPRVPALAVELCCAHASSGLVRQPQLDTGNLPLLLLREALVKCPRFPLVCLFSSRLGVLARVAMRWRHEPTRRRHGDELTALPTAARSARCGYPR